MTKPMTTPGNLYNFGCVEELFGQLGIPLNSTTNTIFALNLFLACDFTHSIQSLEEPKVSWVL